MKWILIILMLPAAGCTAIVESFDPTRPRGFRGNIDYRMKHVHHRDLYALDTRIEWLDKIGHSRAWHNERRHLYNHNLNR